MIGLKRALVCGGGGFIGHHLVEEPQAEGFWVQVRRPQVSALLRNGSG